MMDGLSARPGTRPTPTRTSAWSILTGAGGTLLRRHGPRAPPPTPRPATRSSGATTSVSDIADGVIKPLLKGFLLDKPLIAAVEGSAIAGGTEILQGTDIRIAGESARFGVSEVRWGLYPLGGSVVRLRRQIPYARRLRHPAHRAATCRAAEAKEIGLIGEVVPDGTALERAREVAAHDRRERADRGAGRAEGAAGHRLPAGVARPCASTPQIGMPVFMSDDAKEGPLAFMEKRTPDFQGR